MVLKMSRPQKHPKTGIYQFRKRVPDRLQALLGKKEEKVTLGTRDLAEAKVLHARIAAEIEERWHLLSAGTQALSEKQAVGVAGEIYRDFVAQYEDNPSNLSLTEILFVSAYAKGKKPKIMIAGSNPDLAKMMMQKFLAHNMGRIPELVTTFLQRKGLCLDPRSLKMVTDRVTEAVLQAHEHIKKMAKGDYSPDPRAARFPDLVLPRPDATSPRPTTKLGGYSTLQVFEDYVGEKRISTASLIRWRPIIEKVSKEVPDCRDLSRQWVIGWKNRLLASGLAQTTVRDTYLAVLRATCEWGVANDRLPENPVAKVTVSVPRKIRTRSPGYSKAEAATVLRATFSPTPAKMSPPMASARKWVPWLCAYTGARVGEISQLRKSDIVERDGFHLIWITPEAGTTKDSKARWVAVHSHLVELGFLRFVASSKNGPLFYDKSLARDPDSTHPQHKKVGEKLCKWIRSKEVGLTDDRLQPNHAWRHTFKTLARSAGMDTGARDYMQGHTPATEGEGYGEHLADVLSREIEKIPRFSTAG
ncbi:DUF6538 domain-containing protein [Rhizobium ruizarguesonis]